MQIVYIYIKQPNKKEIQLNLYNEFFYKIENNKLTRQKNSSYSSFIFQNNIKSISAFIGENGSGKSILLENILSTLLNDTDNCYFILYKEKDDLYYSSYKLDKLSTSIDKKIKKIQNKFQIFLCSNIIDSSNRYREISGDNNLTLKYKLDSHKENYKTEEFQAQLKFVLKYKKEVENIIKIPSELHVQVNSKIENLIYSRYLNPLNEKINKLEKMYTNINSIEINLQKSSFLGLDASSIITVVGLKDSKISFYDKHDKLDEYVIKLIKSKKKQILADLYKFREQSRILEDINMTIENMSRISPEKNEVREGSYFYIYGYLIAQIISFFDFLYGESKAKYTELDNYDNYIIEWAEDCLQGLTGNDYFIKNFNFEKVLERIHSILEDCYKKNTHRKINLILCNDVSDKASLIYQISVLFYTILDLFEDSPFYIERNRLRVLGFNIFSECLAGLLDNTSKMINLIDNICKNRSDNSQILMAIDENNIDKYFFEIQNIAYTCNPLTFSWRDMSSGEYAMLNLFSFFPEESEIENDILLIAFDEGELHFHQSLQIKFINILKEFFKKMFPNKVIQILLASHSPFIITDIPNCDVYLLNNNYSELLSKPTQKTFGANIQDILYNPFQLKKGMVGEYAKLKINSLFKEIKKESSKYSHDDLYRAVTIIGEPLIKNRLLKELSNKGSKKHFENNKEIEYLKQRIEELEGIINVDDK